MCGDLGSPRAAAPHTASAILFAQPPTPSQESICPVCSCGLRSWNHGSQSRIQMSINIISMFGASICSPRTQQFPLFVTSAHRRVASQSCYRSMRDGCKHLRGMQMDFVESMCSCPAITASYVYGWRMSFQRSRLWTDIQPHTWAVTVVLYWNLSPAEKLSTACKNRMLNIIFYYTHLHLHVNPSEWEYGIIFSISMRGIRSVCQAKKTRRGWYWSASQLV